MSNKLYEENDIQAIANAIRSKNGSSSTYTVAEMAQAVSNIPTGSGGTNTSDATASAADILSPKTAYISSGKVTGSMVDRSGTTQHTAGGADTQNSGLRFNIPNNGYYNTSNKIFRSNANVANDIGLTASKIVSGNTILGIAGTGGGGGGTDTSDATAIAADILSGKTAYVNGSKITGTMADKSTTVQQTAGGADTQNSGLRFNIPSNGYYSTSNKIYRSNANVANDIGLTAAKIVSGNTILGIAGTGGAGNSQTLGGNPFTCGAWTQVMDEYTSVSITHGLGSTPSSVIIWAVPADASPYGVVTAVFLDLFYLSGVSYLDGTSSDAESSVGTYIYSDSTTFTFDIPSGAVLPAGWTYYWVVV